MPFVGSRGTNDGITTAQSLEQVGTNALSVPAGSSVNSRRLSMAGCAKCRILAVRNTVNAKPVVVQLLGSIINDQSFQLTQPVFLAASPNVTEIEVDVAAVAEVQVRLTDPDVSGGDTDVSVWVFGTAT